MLYDYSPLILLAPLLAFAVIIFGTRVWDMRSRPKVVLPAGHGDHDDHGNHHVADAHGSSDSHVGGHSEADEDDEPHVASLSAGAKASAYVALVIMAFACIYAWVLLFSSLTSNALPQVGINPFSYDWLNIGTVHYAITLHLDRLAIAMLVVVTSIALLVQFYSRGYMSDSAGYARFYAYLSLFVFSMLIIVFAENFLVIFCGWELVGLSSYLLIGFWINKRAKPDEQRPSPASASVQAFVMNRIGDVGFIIGIMILFASTGSFEFTAILPATAHMNPTLLGVAMILVFCGAMGKSAQFPLHTWLPSAMEGPTPVSALIHAATMVAAGVYMIARTSPLFAAAPAFAFDFVASIGAFTAFFAATIALVQSDFKRVLAFSTISQLGYMFVGLGVAGSEGVGPGMFHLFTHAFFKALLFLGAGSVLHALHHAMHKEVQDVRLMGGLATKMPITAATWLIATLAISGFPGFSGFYSKEEIISLAYQNGHPVIYALTLITAGLTAFYMLRAFILAFGGKGGRFMGLWGGPYRGYGEVHESPWTMTVPLIILSVFAIFAGYWTGFFQYVNISGHPVENLNIGALFSDYLTWIGVVVALAGLVVAWVIYGRTELAKINQVVQSNAVLRTIHRILYNRYYIDDLYNWFVKYVIILGIATAAQAFDHYVIDGIVNGVARGVTEAGTGLSRVETGRVQTYMIGFFGGVAVLAVAIVVLITTVWK